jgi:hypothetical protein
MADEKVKFGKSLALAGVIGGVVIAVGLPALLVLFGQFLGAGIITALTIIALMTGGGLAIISAFFGTVIPNHA